MSLNLSKLVPVALPLADYQMRKYQLSDTPRLFEAAIESSNEVYPWLEWCHPQYQQADSESWIYQVQDNWVHGTSFDFALLSADGNRLLGGCGLNEISVSDRCANLGYWIRTSETRKGLATAATIALARFGFEHLDLQRIEIIMATTNVASKAVAQRAGAIYEGTMRSRLRLHGAAVSAHLYSLIPSDFGFPD